MLTFVARSTLLIALVPGALWLGSRYAQWSERRGFGCASRPPAPRWRGAELVDVAVVGDEVLLELAVPTPGSGAGTPPERVWLSGQADEASIAAGLGGPRPTTVRLRDHGAQHVVVEVGDATLAMVRPPRHRDQRR